VYAVRNASAPKATLNVTGCGKFSSDHFAQPPKFWRAHPCALKRIGA
jgi:hypothetical protein